MPRRFDGTAPPAPAPAGSRPAGSTMARSAQHQGDGDALGTKGLEHPRQAHPPHGRSVRSGQAPRPSAQGCARVAAIVFCASSGLRPGSTVWTRPIRRGAKAAIRTTGAFGARDRHRCVEHGLGHGERDDLDRCGDAARGDRLERCDGGDRQPLVDGVDLASIAGLSRTTRPGAFARKIRPSGKRPVATESGARHRPGEPAGGRVLAHLARFEPRGEITVSCPASRKRGEAGGIQHMALLEAPPGQAHRMGKQRTLGIGQPGRAELHAASLSLRCSTSVI